MKYKNQERIWRVIIIIIPILIILSSSRFFFGIFFPLFNFSDSFVSFLDVGQGDAAMIRTPNGKNILIDGGPDNLVLERIGKLLPYFSRRIDIIIISHYHDDHISGLREIISRYDVGAIIYQAGGEGNNDFKSLIDAANDKNIKIIEVNEKTELSFSNDCRLNIFNPLSLNIPKDGNNSLLSKLNCAGKIYLFSGDNELAVEKALLANNLDVSANIMKASHHGSRTSNSEPFIEAVGAEFLVISVGADNRFGHPNQEVLDRAKTRKIKVKRTDISGNITFAL